MELLERGSAYARGGVSVASHITEWNVVLTGGIVQVLGDRPSLKWDLNHADSLNRLKPQAGKGLLGRARRVGQIAWRAKFAVHSIQAGTVGIKMRC